jgi:hypothetical protein
MSVKRKVSVSVANGLKLSSGAGTGRAGQQVIDQRTAQVAYFGRGAAGG